MAQSASKESVERADSGPDVAEALLIIQGIHGEQSEASSVAQSIGQMWERIEKQCGLNRQGAKHFSAILKKPVDKRKDEFRTFIMLARQAGWFDWMNDLVDRAQGNSPAVAAAPKAPSAPKPVEQPAPPPPADSSDLSDAGYPTKEEVNLKTGMVETWTYITEVEDGEEVDVLQKMLSERAAKPEELAKAREEQADFDDAEVAPDLAEPAAEPPTPEKPTRGGRPKLKAVN